MISLLQIVVHTANILGAFNDPFEFEGDYGPENNSVRQTVFELVVSQEALGNLPKDEAIEADNQHGPLLSDLITSELLEELSKQQQKMNSSLFGEEEVTAFKNFILKFGHQKAFKFLRNSPPDLLALDKILSDKAAREGRYLDLPTLGSVTLLEDTDSTQLKKNLLHKVFNEEYMAITKPENIVRASLKKVDVNSLQTLLGSEASLEDLYPFASPAGQTLFYWLYHSLNLHLIPTDDNLVEQINDVKKFFMTSLSNPLARAEVLRERLISANSAVLFTQESDSFIAQTLVKDGLYHSVDKQNALDGTLVFLQAESWEPDYSVIPVEDYEGYAKGRLSIILARYKDSGETFLLASGHGNSTRAEDGRLQIAIIMQKYDELAAQHEGLQLVIGIDANTKSDQEVALLREQLDSLGLTTTHVGPTTVKKRMVTVQHSKAGRAAIDEEDFIITLKPECGGRFLLTEPTVGFDTKAPDINRALPDLDNPSDHYPVGVTLLRG